jgi:hypothetical protein
VKEAAEGQQSTAAEGDVVESMTGFSKIKRDLAIKLGVDHFWGEGGNYVLAKKKPPAVC